MKKIFLFFVMIAIFLGIFLGVRSAMLNSKKEEVHETSEEVKYVDELILPLIEVDTLNPLLTKNIQVSNVLKLVYEPLFDFDESNKLISALGENYMQKDDGSWIISIRPNVVWHSEKKFSVDDVIYTINAIKANPDSVFSENVKNITCVSILDDSSILIAVAERDEYLPYKLTFPIIPEYYFRDSLNDVEKTNRFVGTGPYMYLETFDDSIKLKWNSNWWKTDKAKLNTIYLKKYASYGEAIKGFKSSEVDLIITSMTSWEKKFGVVGINCYRYENNSFDVLIPNCEKTILGDSSVRRAISYGINRDNIITEIYEKNASKQDIMVHSFSWINDKTQSAEFNQEKAKQLLINASWKLNKNVFTKTINNKNVTLKFNIMVNKENEDKIAAANKIKENLEGIGIKVTVVPTDKATFLKNIESGNFDVALATIDSKSEFDVLKLLKEKNYAKYDCTPLLENMNQLYLANVSLENAYKEFEQSYRNEMPYIGLYYKANTLLTNKAVKGNIVPTNWNPFHNIYNWSK